MSRGKRGKHAQKRLTDQEILEQFLQKSGQSRSLAKERKGILRGALIGAFLQGPFLTLLPFATWFELIPAWYFGIPMGINACYLMSLAVSFHFTSKKVEKSILDRQEQLTHFVGIGGFLYISWIALYGSLMALLSSIGSFVRISGAPWWIPPLMYGASGAGLWVGRKEILRAIVEGPEAHPWFRPIRLFFATSLGFLIFLGAVLRIFLNWMEQINANIALLFLTVQLLTLSILFLGLAMLGGIMSYLHYQRWRGMKELKI